VHWYEEAWVIYWLVTGLFILLGAAVVIVNAVLPQDKPCVRSYIDPEDDNCL
jgi:hypothetical protein